MNEQKLTRRVVTGVETTASTAERAGCDPSVVRRWILEGRLSAEKVGGVWLIPADEADRFVRSPRMMGRPPKRAQQLTLDDVEED